MRTYLTPERRPHSAGRDRARESDGTGSGWGTLPRRVALSGPVSQFNEKPARFLAQVFELFSELVEERYASDLSSCARPSTVQRSLASKDSAIVQPVMWVTT